MNRILLAGWLGAVVQSWAGAAPIECRRAVGAVTIDGRADESAWKSAQWIDGFHVLGQSVPAATRTRAALLWDDESLYFFAEMEDADLFADVTEHDGATWNNDVFEIFLQPRRGERRYYEFEVNAANTGFDMFIERTGDFRADFLRCVGADEFRWRTAVQLRGTLNRRDDRDTGWSVEGRIPWSDLAKMGGRPTAGADWAFLLSRYDYTAGRPAELSASADLKKEGGFHQPAAWGVLHFVGAVGNVFVPWENTRLKGSPEPPPPFHAVRAYPNIDPHGGKTAEHDPHGPVAVQREPGAERIVYLENYGYGELRTVLRRFAARAGVDTAETLLELKEHGYSLTFHPDFSRNGFVFLGLNGPGPGGKKQTRIVRYTMDRANDGRVDPVSRRLIIEWPSNGHNGGDCAFGRDGMLYVTSGDGTSGLDVDVVGQDTGSLLAKVLRIDVDGVTGNEGYRVPPDNPFVGNPAVRPETWAYGLRNPWRITGDRESGQIWVGENGQDLREYAHLLGRGENYGWSAYEGSRAFLTNRLRGPAPFTRPTIEHDHGLFRSLTGGVVYHGGAFPELVGAYLYGDFSTGRIWAMRHDGSRVLWHKELADTPLAIVNFGFDVDGEPLIVDYSGGFHRLERTFPRTVAPTFPRKLSETGLFADTPAQRPAPGVIPYEINAPGWHDGARGEHWLALPSAVHLHPEKDGGWAIDDGAVLVQTLSLAAQRIETRLLLKAENDWAAYTYVWNEAQTDADLADAGGRRISLTLAEGRREWLVPGRSDCLVCHSRAANFSLTLNTRQLNRIHADESVESQLRWLEAGGAMADTKALGKDLETLPRYTNLGDTNAPLEQRVRSYLAVNCSHCHTSDGGGNSLMNMLPGLKLAETHLIDQPPQHGNFGSREARVVAPGAPGRSILVTRMALRIPGQMPPLGTLRADGDAVGLMAKWISSLPTVPASAIPGAANP